MNQAHKSIYNERTGTFVAVAENVKGRGKRSSGSQVARAAAAAAIVSASIMATGVLAAVDIPNDGEDNKIVFTGPGDGEIEFQWSGSISGLSGLSVSGTITADQLEVGTEASIASGGKSVATVGQLYDTKQGLQAVTDNVNDHASTIGELDSRVGTNENAIEDNKSAIQDNKTDITSLDTRIVQNENDILSLQGDVIDNQNDITQIFAELGVDPSQGEGAGIKYFRANSDKDDADATGKDSIAIGPEAEAQNTSSVAIGDGAKAAKGSGDSDQENTIAIGTDSESSAEGGTAIGHKSKASANDAVALGSEAAASGANSLALGSSAEASGSAGVAMGDGAQALAADNISIGRAAGEGTGDVTAGDQKENIAIGLEAGQNIEGQGNVTMGVRAGSGTDGDNNVAFGTKAGRDIQGTENISIGFEANTGSEGHRGVAIGHSATSLTDGIALGTSADAGKDSVALGQGAKATNEGIAIGYGAKAANGHIALGRNSIASADDVGGNSAYSDKSFSGGVFSVGSNGSESFTRRIVNVEDGANDTDAVNVRQLRAFEDEISAGASVDYKKLADKINTNWSDEIKKNKLHYLSINDGDSTKNNKDNHGASAEDSMALGPNASAAGDRSTVIGERVHSDEGAKSSVVIGSDVDGLGFNSTTIGNSGSEARDESGIAIGTNVLSRDENSIVIGRDSYTNGQGTDGPSDNSVVVGTGSSSTATEGIVIGKSSLVNAERGIAQGSNAKATAADAIAQGTESRASGTSAIAQGTESSASGTNAIAQGTDTIASATNAQASGTGASARASSGVAIGTGSQSGLITSTAEEEERNINSIAIGNSALAKYENALAVGVDAQATEENALALGTAAQANKARAIAQGHEAMASAEQAMAMGAGANASAQDAIAQGAGSEASGLGGMALGAGARASDDGSVALGQNAETAEAVGTSKATLGGLTYGDFAGDKPVATVSVGKGDEKRTITNVAAGRISDTSTDAINGSQLHATNQNLGNLATSTKDILGGNAELDGDGSLSMTNIGGTGESTVHDAIGYAAQGWQLKEGGEQGGETIRPGGTATFEAGDNMEVSRDGATIRYATKKDVEFDSIDIGDSTLKVNGDSLIIGGSTNIDMGDNKITNVAPGTDPNDAVNVSQLESQDAELTAKGLSFVGDDGENVHRELGETLSITGGADDDELTEDNIGVIKESDGGLKVQLAQNIDLGTDGSVTIGDTNIDNKGLAIEGGPSITIDGIDAGDKTITNVAPGVDGTDAVNLDQLKGLEDTVASGWTATDENNNDAKIAPGGVVTFSGEENISVAQEGEDDQGEVVVSLNKDVDLGDDGSLTVGNTTVNDHGLTIENGPSITINGIDASNNKITNVAPGAIDARSKDAVNGSQLYAMGDSISRFLGGDVTLNDDGTLNLGDYFDDIFGDDSGITNLADALEPWTVGAEGGNSEEVLPGDNVDISGGGNAGSGSGSGGSGSTGSGDGNIVVDIEHDGEDHDVTLDLADNVNINQSVTVGNSDGDDPYLSMGNDGDEGSAGSLNFYGEKDSDGERLSASQSVVDGPGGVGTDQDENDSTRLGYTDQDGDDHTLATLDDGLSFGANDGDDHDAPLNTQVDIVGANGNDDWSEFDEGQNIMTKVTKSDEGEGQITVALAQDVSVNSITAVDVDATNVTADSVEINNGPTINENGIDMSGKRITNLAPGIDREDAVNVGQLHDTASNLQGQIDDVRGDLRRTDKRLRAGVAAAMATAGLPQAYLPGKSMMAMAGGAWNGESGMAIGYSTVTDNGNWIVKLSGNASSRGDYGGTVGVGYQW